MWKRTLAIFLALVFLFTTVLSIDALADIENAATESAVTTETEIAETEDSNTENPEVENAGTENADTENTDTEDSNAKNTDSESKENADAENKDTENVDTVNTDTENAVTEKALIDNDVQLLGKQYKLTILISGWGDVEKKPGPNLLTGKYNAGTVVKLWPEPISILGYYFAGWDPNYTVPEKVSDYYTVKMDSDITVRAIFSNTVRLEISKEGNGTVRPKEGTHTYYYRDKVTLEATPAKDWKFKGWYTGPDFQTLYSTNSNIKVTMDSNKAFKAVFKPSKYTLVVNKVGLGTVSPDVGTHTYNDGTKVNLSATPAEGWQFEGWLIGDSTVPNKEITSITMDSDKTITAVFSLIPKTYYTLTVEIVGEGTTDPEEGESSYEEGTEVQLSAEPA
ncbi:MAG: InlB B-repeat-containing protein, partial [Clostridiaceae bacterium]|nr:InlB B-repeat-containing protein [Clostridiaceae bacterium]